MSSHRSKYNCCHRCLFKYVNPVLSVSVLLLFLSFNILLLHNSVLLYQWVYHMLLFGRSCNSCWSRCSGGEFGQYLWSWYGKNGCACPYLPHYRKQDLLTLSSIKIITVVCAGSLLHPMEQRKKSSGIIIIFFIIVIFAGSKLGWMDKLIKYRTGNIVSFNYDHDYSITSRWAFWAFLC